MTWDEIADLLSLAAVFDQRTAGEEDVKGWHLVARLERWPAPAAQRVLVEHYARGADRPRITPAAISDGIRSARSRAAASFVVPDCPDDLAGRDYPAWLRAQRDAHVQRVLDSWAEGGLIPDSASVEALAGRADRALAAGAPPHLRAAIESGLSRIGRPPPERPRPSRLPHQPAADPDRRAGAEAELAARRPAPMPEPDAAPESDVQAPS